MRLSRLSEQAELLSEAGHLAVSEGRLSDAAKAFRQAVQLVPADKVYRYALGLAYQQAGDWERALEALRGSLRCDPKWQPTHDAFAAVLEQKLGRRPSMQELVLERNTGVERGPEIRRQSAQVAAFRDKGNAYFKQRRYHEAVVAYSDAIMLDPDSHVLRVNRALALLKSGQYDEALEDADLAMRMMPDWAKAHFRRGEA